MKRLAPLLAVGLLTACAGTSPEPDTFIFSPVRGAPVADITATVALKRPVLPAYLDRPDFVRQDSASSLDIDESRRWAAPLDEMTEDTLAADLRERLPNAVITTTRDNITAPPRFTVGTDFAALNATREGSLLSVHLFIKDAAGCTETPQSIAFRVVSPDSDTVAGQSALVAGLADRIVTFIKAAPAPQNCPGLPRK